MSANLPSELTNETLVGQILQPDMYLFYEGITIHAHKFVEEK